LIDEGLVSRGRQQTFVDQGIVGLGLHRCAGPTDAPADAAHGPDAPRSGRGHDRSLVNALIDGDLVSLWQYQITVDQCSVTFTRQEKVRGRRSAGAPPGHAPVGALIDEGLVSRGRHQTFVDQDVHAGAASKFGRARIPPGDPSSGARPPDPRDTQEPFAQAQFRSNHVVTGRENLFSGAATGNPFFDYLSGLNFTV